jgi:putative DNA primase/helicase
MKRAHRVELKEIDFVAPGIPAGMFTVVSGRPGGGKSTYTSWLAAQVTRTGGTVIFSNQEDGHATTVRPRLEVAGAILERVFLPDEPYVLPQDCAALERRIERTGCKLVIMDSAAQHFGPTMSSGQSIRKALTPLKQMLERTGCALVFVDHLIKRPKSTSHPLEALSGAGSGLPAAARCVYAFGRHPEEPDLRVLAPVKVNAFRAESSFSFAMTDAALFTVDGTEVEVGKLDLVSDECEIDASQVIAFKGDGKAVEGVGGIKATIAAEWLIGALMFGTRDASDVKAEGAGAGFSWRTLQRAAEKLDVQRQRVGFGKGSKVEWSLPDGHPAFAVAAQMGGRPTGSAS